MKIRDVILQLGTYKPPLEGRNPDNYLLLDFNESPLPPPAHVTEALISFIKENHLNVYPSYGNFLDLLSEYTGMPPEYLLVTNGSDQAIEVILRCILDDGDEMIVPKPGFSMFWQIAGTIGTKVISPFYKESMEFPFEDVQTVVTEKTRVIVVINPNNPTGTTASLKQIEMLLKQFPEIAILVDEAYVEFTGNTCSSLLKKYSNLIIVRTFSKAFAVPSLRLGYVMADSDFIQHLYKIRGPYDVNMLAIVAATAQLKNQGPWRSVIQEVMEEAKPMLEQFFEENQVRYIRGEAHFMLVEPPNAQEAVAYLKDNGILVRPMSEPISHMFRMNAGTIEQTKTFMTVFKQYLSSKM